MKQLPGRFCENMKALLGEEYPQYAASLSEKPQTALRINTGKITLEEWGRRNPFSTSEVSWTEKGFYFDAGQDRPSKHPYYYAGLYYIQEPSAMVPAVLLPVFPGEKVLDLCAAPGGKATELGAKLLGRGLLVANDISISRAMALAKNVQMAGIINAVVTAEKPEKLAVAFPAFFDKILVDAPCSGEGMFRREPAMAREWEKRGPAYYETIQKQILSEAYRMLKPGGMLVYSTCTFSVRENEGVVQWLLDRYPDLKIVPVERKEGFSEGRPDMVQGGSEFLRECVRIFPHRAGGEGHFAVLLQKGKRNTAEELAGGQEAQGLIGSEGAGNGVSIRELADRRDTGIRYGEEIFTDRERKTGRKQTETGRKKYLGKESKGKKALAAERQKKQGEAEKENREFCRQFSFPGSGQEMCYRENSLCVLPKEMSSVPDGFLRIVSQGLPLCEWKHKPVPSPQLALALKKEHFSQVLDLEASDGRVVRYLKGETLAAEIPYRGDVLVCVDGFGLGWAQGSGRGVLKNKYYPGWRYQ